MVENEAIMKELEDVTGGDALDYNIRQKVFQIRGKQRAGTDKALAEKIEKASLAARLYCTAKTPQARYNQAQHFKNSAADRARFVNAVRAICGPSHRVSFADPNAEKKKTKRQDPANRGYTPAKRMLKDMNYRGKPIRLSKAAYRNIKQMADSQNKDVTSYIQKAGRMAKAAGRVTVNEKVVNLMKACQEY
jgi:histone H3/H4